MQLSWIGLLQDIPSQAVVVFTTGKKDNIWSTVLLLLTCCLFSLLFSSFLSLYLLYTLDYGAAVSGGITSGFGILLTIALFLSKRVRCLGTLFVISVFMKKSRNLLLTAGTSIVILKNIRNTLENLSALLKSMICNLKLKKEAIMAPLSNYVQVIKWLGNILKGVTDLGVLKVDSQLKVSPKLESVQFREKLSDAEQRLNETVRYTHALVHTIFSVTDRMFPAISFLVLMTFIALHIKKFCKNMKYQNTFISRKFISYDEEQKAKGNPHVLPLTPQEDKRYSSVPSACLTTREGKAVVKFGIPVLSHFVAWVIFISLDALLYCFVDIVTRKLSELEPLNIPMLMSIKDIPTFIGIKLEEENRQRDFSFSVTLFEKECLPKPKLLLYDSVVPLAAILLVLLIMALLASKLSQLRLMVCEHFFSTAAEDRVEYLHAKILRKRQKRKTREDGESSFTSLIFKLHFWCPLLFRPKDPDPKSPKSEPIHISCITVSDVNI